ncbi:MAG: sigma-70 family RNA polymerase sigma factor [Acidobacteria bacterium]|nr:sigma-70 family RNA polymerase sigma factor [Acidobacteriota bacterium]
MTHQDSDTPSHPLAELTDGIYQELRRKARRLLRQSSFNTLDVTGLVHETYLDLAQKNATSAEDRHALLAICVTTMREILVDHARRRCALKRGSGQGTTTLEPDMLAQSHQPEHVLAIDDAMHVLHSFNPRLAQLVACRFFAGLSEEETAEHLQLSLRTVQRDWQRARAWLRREMRR